MAIGPQKKLSGKKMFQRSGLNIAGGLFDAGMEFYNRRDQHPDESYATSSAWALASYGAWMIAPGIMWGYTLGDAALEGAKAAAQFGESQYTRQAMRYNNGGTIGGGYMDSDRAYTARQRGLQAIENSRMNARSALGNEARSLHGR